MRSSLVTEVVLAGTLGCQPFCSSSQEPAASRVTFSEAIAPILYEHCVTCHRPGEIGPFSLISYDDVAPRGAKIAEVTASRIMPPWQPAHGFGEFAGERRLSDEQIALIGTWVDQGMQRGDPARTPRLPQFPDGWLFGDDEPQATRDRRASEETSFTI